MKKVVLIALGTVAISGCQSVPEKPVASQVAPAATVEVVVAPVQQVEPVVVPVEVVEAAAKPVVVPVSEPVVIAKEETQPIEVAPVVTAASLTKPVPTAAPVVSAQAQALDPRMDKIVKLIYSSSGAKQVIGSDNPKAHQHHAKAKGYFDQALHAADKAEAGRYLNLSVKTMYAAIRAASSPSLKAKKHQADFNKLKRSVDTFIEQHQRISDEKGSGSEGQALRTQVSVIVAKAEKALAAKQYDNAQYLLRESFEMLRNSIESMREGETLVRSLNFATKKDEYDYELERYQSQLVLVDVLLKEKRASSAYVAKQVDKYIAVAEEARGKAESAASTGDHQAAITLLEQARKQIVRALRTGGIYVPG